MIPAQIRAKVEEILQDGQEHTIVQLVLECDTLIPPEYAARTYVNETSTESQSYRKTRKLEQRIHLGRYSAVRRAIRSLIQSGKYVRAGRNLETTYRLAQPLHADAHADVQS